MVVCRGQREVSEIRQDSRTAAWPIGMYCRNVLPGRDFRLVERAADSLSRCYAMCVLHFDVWLEATPAAYDNRWHYGRTHEEGRREEDRREKMERRK